LILCGCLGFLPILGFWMIPAGLIVLSHDLAGVRRFRRRAALFLGPEGRTRCLNGDRDHLSDRRSAARLITSPSNVASLQRCRWIATKLWSETSKTVTSAVNPDPGS
jgi:hypothetical protein